MLQTRCKDPSNPDLAEYGANSTDLGTAKEGDAPQSVVSDQGGRELATIDPEAPLIVDDGTVAGGLDPWHEDDAESCVSGFTGSSCRSEWELEHDDVGDWDSEKAGEALE
jgi:hypothetical protein